MKKMSMWRRVAVGLFIVAAATSNGVTPASAAPQVATCENNHICFFQSYTGDNNNAASFRASGSMSDQTIPLITKPVNLAVDVNGQQTLVVRASGKISNFENSHYADGSGVNDSISTVVNNTGSCLYLWGNKDFKVPDGHLSEAIEIGPHTTRYFTPFANGFDNGNVFRWADVDNHISSAFMVGGDNEFCTQGSGGSRFLRKNQVQAMRVP